MRLSQKGLDFIKSKEGLRLIAYNIGDKWTIGYGNTFYEFGDPVRPGDTITKAKAESLFVYVAQNTFAANVYKSLAKKLNQSQFDAVVSYAYNRGLTAWNNSKLRRMINENPQNEAIRKQFEIEWGNNQLRKNSLIQRRKKEAELYFSEVSSSNNILSFTAFIIFLFILSNLTKKDNEKTKPE